MIILLDGLAPLFDHLALAQLVMRPYHLLEIDGQDSSTHSSYLKLGKSFIPFEVYLDILSKVQSNFLTLFVDKDIVI